MLDSKIRTEYLLRAKRLLKKFHNQVGDWRRGELKKVDFDKFPQGLKAKLPEWKIQLTRTDWHDFETQIFDPAWKKVLHEHNIYKEEVGKEQKWTVNVEDLIE